MAQVEACPLDPAALVIKGWQLQELDQNLKNSVKKNRRHEQFDAA
jgi:hypothetical protein